VSRERLTVSPSDAAERIHLSSPPPAALEDGLTAICGARATRLALAKKKRKKKKKQKKKQLHLAVELKRYLPEEAATLLPNSPLMDGERYDAQRRLILTLSLASRPRCAAPHRITNDRCDRFALRDPDLQGRCVRLDAARDVTWSGRRFSADTVDALAVPVRVVVPTRTHALAEEPVAFRLRSSHAGLLPRESLIAESIAAGRSRTNRLPVKKPLAPTDDCARDCFVDMALTRWSHLLMPERGSTRGRRLAVGNAGLTVLASAL